MYIQRNGDKSCYFTANNITEIDYKNIEVLRKFINENGKIIPSRITGTCASHQRQLTAAIKKARFLGLLPYCDNHK